MMTELHFLIQMMSAQKILEITGIHERRYVTDNLCTSDIALIAAEKQLKMLKLTEKLLIIHHHGNNFGDVKRSPFNRIFYQV